MTALRLILLYAHLLGFAVLLGAAVTQYVAKPLRINALMIWGAGAQLVTGIALSAPLRGEGEEPHPAKLAVKLVVALMIFAMVFFSRKREAVNSGHFLAIIGLTLANAAVAVFWR
jgi:predicted membrane protein